MASRAAVAEGERPFSCIDVYSTKARLYAVAYADDGCRILAFARQDGVGILGCFRFTECHYLLVATRREYVGHVAGHKVYRVADTALLPLGLSMQRIDNNAAESIAERRYRKLLLGVDLTRNFFFSYTYRLTDTLQANHTAAAAGSGGSGSGGGGGSASAGVAGGGAPTAAPGRGEPPGAASFEGSMFAWNAHLTRPLRAAAGSARWTVALMHGFWQQRQVSVFGRQLTITLVARRSRHFAGTRYRKRGINDQGFVANEVETEQIVDAGIDWATGQPLWSSVVQVRGSVPLFWSQQATPLSPKPDIVLQQYDPIYAATARHFSDLGARYGHPVVVLNLLRAKERRPRETLLRREYAASVSLVNDGLPDRERIGYVAWDFARHAKQPGANILVELAPLVGTALDMTGVYVHGPDTCPVCAPFVARRMASLAATAASAPGGHLACQRRRREVEPGAAHNLQGRFYRAARARLGLVRGAQGGEGAGEGDEYAWPPALLQLPPPEAPAERPPQRRPSGSGSPSGGAPALRRRAPPRVPPPQARPKGRATAPVTSLQSGVLRTNCVDCLDRTNVAQFAFGLAAFGRQLSALGLADDEYADIDSSASFHLMALYEDMGHTLALQYGGSEAHAAFFQRRKGEWEAATQSRDLVTSIRRFYSNAYTDAEKQDAINLFLGQFVPQPGRPALWELDSDYYLWNRGPWIRYLELTAEAELAQAQQGQEQQQQEQGQEQGQGEERGQEQGQEQQERGQVEQQRLEEQQAEEGPQRSSEQPPSRADRQSAFASAQLATTFAPAAAAPAASAAAGAPPGAAAGLEEWLSWGRLVEPGLSSSPLLPLTYSDGISLDAANEAPAAAGAAAEGGWDLRGVFQQLLAAAQPAAAAPQPSPHGPRCRIVAFDSLLALAPRVHPVRLYPAPSARRVALWDAVQQAFAFFSTEGLTAAATGGRAGGSSGGADWRTSGGGAGEAGEPWSPREPGSPSPSDAPSRSDTASALPGAGAPLRIALAGAGAGANALLSAALGGLGAGAAAAAALGGGGGSPSHAGAASGPGAAPAAGAAAAAAAAPLIDGSYAGLAATRGDALRAGVPALNDILEVRSEPPPARMIRTDEGQKPAGRWLDMALEQLVWSQLPAARAAAASGLPAPVPALNDFIELRQEGAGGAPDAAAAAAAASGGAVAAGAAAAAATAPGTPRLGGRRVSWAASSFGSGLAAAASVVAGPGGPGEAAAATTSPRPWRRATAGAPSSPAPLGTPRGGCAGGGGRAAAGASPAALLEAASGLSTPVSSAPSCDWAASLAAGAAAGPAGTPRAGAAAMQAGAAAAAADASGELPEQLPQRHQQQQAQQEEQQQRQQRQQRQQQRPAWPSAHWQSSAEVAGPSLERWFAWGDAATAAARSSIDSSGRQQAAGPAQQPSAGVDRLRRDLGLSPELAAAWSGDTAAAHEAWAEAAAERAGAYARWCAALLLLADAGTGAELAEWYAQHSSGIQCS
ncbi:phosphoinositide phosphatase [Raphidocelis subcapitata]|uniref:Phosphoinositide phosphatase n=1 Tax=Raphidocelis subcapitata TaxID=307507 RepID=A0A2V0PJF0_9CHLO|nr:phosphoinositide phosphatase [Raphidocelis subcapitata]|eukprot:GBF98113.1 phosphoinositide phosphatase [Raphidocelis subcapitata]